MNSLEFFSYSFSLCVVSAQVLEYAASITQSQLLMNFFNIVMW